MATFRIKAISDKAEYKIKGKACYEKQRWVKTQRSAVSKAGRSAGRECQRLVAEKSNDCVPPQAVLS